MTAALAVGLTSDVVRTFELPVAQRQEPISHREIPLAAEEQPSAEPAYAQPDHARWPDAGKASVSAGASSRRAGGLPVTVAAKGDKERRFDVEVVDQDAAHRAGVAGVVFTVTPTDGTIEDVSVGLDYSGFRNAGGAEFGSRLRLEQLPDCALSTPDKAECQVRTPLPSTNDPAAKTVTAPAVRASTDAPPARKVTAGAPSAQTMVLAATAGSSGPDGTFEASSLSPSGTWAVSGSSGSFSWSYPITLPPTSSGSTVAPSVALSYSSSSVDGRTSATNSQTSWIGQGWNYSPGSIERTYRTCATDKTLPQAQQTGDLCWAGQIVTMNLGGQATELVYQEATNTWRASVDGGARIELLIGAGNGVHDGEYWKVTNTAGVSYYFGRNRGPGYTGQEQTNSAWTVPVYGPRAGDKCHNPSGFASSWCMQAWRWNLDFVEDPHGNVTAYYYDQETNHYGANTQTAGVSYTRGGTLKRIDYGLRNTGGSIYGAVAPNQVVFGVAERCLPDAGFDCAPSKFTADNATRWPDTPQDQECKPGAVCNNHSPSYWSTKRLTTITTQYNQGSGPVKVDEYRLTHDIPTLTDNAKELLLQSITRTGFRGTDSITLPAITFTHQAFDNRVAGYSGLGGLARWRITNIKTETGTGIIVDYSAPDCTKDSVPTDLANNTRRCYPVYRTLPFNQNPTLDFFHKYVVDKVLVTDGALGPNGEPRLGASPTQITTYTYLGTPAWHHDDFELVQPEHRTYGQYRGYGKVEVRTGDTQRHDAGVHDKQTLTRTTYFRGMDADTLPGGAHRTATVTNSLGETTTDHFRYTDTAYETEVFNGDGGPRISTTITDPTVIGTTATRARTGLPALTADVMGIARTRTITHLAAGGTRTAVTTNRYDDTGRLVARTESGDGVPDLCTKTGYADNTTTWVRDRVSEVTVSQQSCPTDGVAQSSILSSSRTYYDQSTILGQTTAGDPTRVDTATANTNDQLTFATTDTIGYDISGRVTSKTDALQRITNIAYTPADGGVVTKTVTTNPKNQTSTVELEPARGKPTATIDVGSRRTDVGYDALGRVTEVWKPGQIRRSGGGSPAITYEYLVRDNGPLAVTTKALVDYIDGTNYLTKIDLFDAFGQLRQTQADAVDGGNGRVGKDVLYDSHGWARITNNRYVTSGVPTTTLVQVDASGVNDRTVTDYDGAGRAVLATAYNGSTATWKTRTVHGGDGVTVFPPQGGTITTKINDVRGRDAEVRHYTNPPTVTGDTVTGGAYQTTTHEYTALGQLKKSTDPVGNQWTFSYDFLGRKTSQTDPDAGASSTTYDLAGQILTTTDARGTTLAFTYDVLGRKTAEYADSTSGTMLASWSYDNAINGVGLPGYTTRYTPDGQYRTGPTMYNGQGLVSKTVTQLPAAETGLTTLFTTTFGYTSTGQVFQVQPPTTGGLPGEVIGTKYNKYGQPIRTDGSNAYVSDASYTAFGEASQYLLGPSNNSAWLNYDYDPQTRRLTHTSLHAQQTPAQIDKTEYTYDPVGNVTRSANTQGADGQAPVRTQCYTYDALRRLNNAWTATDNCAATPTTTPGHANIGGPTPYWTSWTFEPGGLRTTQTQHALPGTTGDTTTTYTYPTSGSAQPHALASATTTGPSGSTLSSYGYDTAGNTTRRTMPSGEHTLTWDKESRLATVNSPAGTTKYVYDADGNQLVRRDPGKTTLYLPGQELTRDNTSGAITGTRYYTHNGTTVAVRVGNTNPTYLVSDLHNTMSVAVQSVGFAVSRRVMDPYGNQLDQTAGLPWPDRHGFLNKPVSQTTGLTDIGARKYDAATGRFISVDPILDLTNSQQWTGYAYADNNPTTFSDPTGLATWMCPDGECGGGKRPSNGLGYDNSIPTPRVDPPSPVDRTPPSCTTSNYPAAKSCGTGNPTRSTSGYPACPNCQNGPMTREKAQLLLTIIGLFPVVGEVADLANCGIHGAHGEHADAALSCGGAVPVAGMAASLAKIANGGRKLDHASDGVTAAGKCVNSFTGDTHVLMADGTTKRIDEIKVGDKIANNEPEREQVEENKVIAVHITDADKEYVDLTIVASEGPKTISTTAHHLFYNATTGKWTNADGLEPGDQLQTPGNGRVAVHATRQYSASLRTYNLTVDGIHTYYVLAGRASALVHNCNGLADPWQVMERIHGAKDGHVWKLHGPGTPAKSPGSGTLSKFGAETSPEDVINVAMAGVNKNTYVGPGNIPGTHQHIYDTGVAGFGTVDGVPTSWVNIYVDDKGNLGTMFPIIR
ncbi:RHS repeat-associated core domain-containing protein [Actinosynnema sp. CS-041913]|uniref:RHS repeat-associated core domain-containing protein n=1 Tax=Actinosynnema sp. CS-041913 TaxID=3239917 RepID=UPI003D8A40E6